MRSLLLVTLASCTCGPIDATDVPDATAPRPDAGRPQPAPDAGPAYVPGVEFQKHSSVPFRARGLWSLNGQSLWVVGDQNNIWRYDSRGWQSVAPPEGNGVDWTEVHGDGSSIWAVGERGDAGSFLYLSRLNAVRLIEAEGHGITAPHLVSAYEGEPLWVGGDDQGLGALLVTADFGAHWSGQLLPECPPIVGGWTYAFRDKLGISHPTWPDLLARDSTEVVSWDSQTDWERSQPMALEPLRGPAFVFETASFDFRGFLVGDQHLLYWSGSAGFAYMPRPYVTASPVEIGDGGFAPRAVRGFSEYDVWAVGGDTLALRTGDFTWETMTFAGQDFIDLSGDAASDLWLLSSSGDVFHRVPGSD